VVEEDYRQSEQAAPCGCLSTPNRFLVIDKELGMDDNFALVSILICSVCGQKWLRYFFEIEAFTASGRWYLGTIKAEQSLLPTAENAKVILEGLSWYFYGGSYYGGKSGKTSGRIFLNP
jgi:hypothetical protein